MPIVIEYIPVLVAVAAFLCISLLFWGILQYRQSRSKKREFIEKIQTSSQKKSMLDVETSLEDSPDQNPVLNFLSSLGKTVAGEKVADPNRLRAVFLKAGIRRRNAPAILWGTKVLLTPVFPVAFLIARIGFGKFLYSPSVSVYIVAVLALAGFYLPDIWLRLKTDRRKERIRDGFADALDLLVVCVEAGMGLDAAIHRVATEIELENKTLSEELRLMTLELRAGKMRRDALKNLAVRTDLEDVHSLATLLIQADKLGTSISQALRVYSDTFRTKRQQQAEEMAAKIPVKLVIPLILFIFPSLFVATFGPAAIRIYQVLLPTLMAR
jgi:tight adherence protein C